MDKAVALKELGNKEYMNRNYLKAIDFYGQAISIKPEAIFYTNRATCFIELKQFDRAIDEVHKSIELDKTYTRAYFRGAQAYAHLGRLEEAFELTKKGIEQNPNEQQIRREYDNLQILINYKTSVPKHIEQEEYSDALRKINGLLERCTAEPRLVEQKIEVLCLLNDMKSAKTFLAEKERTLKQCSPEAFYIAAAMIARFSNDLAEAKTNLQNAVSSGPINPATVKEQLKLVTDMEAIKKRATEAFGTKKYAEAISLYNEALTKDTKNRIWNSVNLSNKASCLMQLKRSSEALELMKQATEFDPQNAKYLYKRGKLEKDLQQWENAETSMRKAKTLDPSLTIDHDLKEISKKVKEINKKDYYAILEVQKTAPIDEIKKKYKDLVKKWHPDKHSGNKDDQDKAEKKFKEISEAYKVISDPDKRKRYDIGGLDAENDPHSGFSNMHDFFGSRGTADPFIQMFFNSGSHNSFSFGGNGAGNQRGGFPSFMHGDSDDPFARFRRR